MKRSLLFNIAAFVLMAGVIHPALAERRISVTQLEQTVAELKSAPDADAARRLSELQLTERLSPRRFTALTQLTAGEKSRQALLAIADQSEFLNLPASEIPPNPTPLISEQRRIMGLVALYVKNSIPQLPNFFATRTTDHFEDTPQLQRAAEFFIPYEPLHFINRSQASVFYQSGREVVDTNSGTGKAKPSSQGLTTWGVFGPVLGSVLVDAATSKLAWSHWEHGPTGPVAVFDFHVPQEKSHYEVNYCCDATEAATYSADVHPFRRIVPYHGSMTIDPSTGVILRLVVEAELKSSDPVTRASILVDYGPVEIGGKTYTCPIRSLSSTVAQTVQVDSKFKYALANQLQPLKTSLNDVSFGNYHMFRSEMRVLTPEEAELVQQAQATAPALVPATEEHASIKPAEPTPSPGPSPSDSKAETAPASIATTSAPTSLAAKSEEPATSEISTAAASGLPDIPAASAPSTPDSGYHLRTTSRLVEVTVVAFDKKGHPVTDLKPTDLEIYDNGRKQNINAFTQASAETAANSTTPSPSPAEPTFTNRPPAASPTPTASPTAATPSRQVTSNTTIFLIDASHIAFSDLTYARSEMLRFLENAPADEPVGLYIVRKYGFQILKEPTTDHAELAEALSKWMPSAQDLAQSQNEEERNRQQMNYVHSLTDIFYVNGNLPTGQADSYGPPDPRLRSLGDNPQRDVLIFLVGIARHLAATNGHKSLIWVASDNVLADFSDTAPSMEKGDKHIDVFSLRAREALNDAHVSIYPLDASQLEAGGVGANIQHGNVQVAPGSEMRARIELEQLPPGLRQEATEALAKSQRDINPGRLKAQMQQDTHAIQPAFRELAEATGGRALRRAGDIAAELDSIVNDGRAAYALSFAPDTPADGSYHHLTVKLAAKRNITLRYRTGYLYEKEPTTLKERFQNAVWRPADITEIALTATPATNTNPATLRLNIAATDLALAQQAGLWMDKLDIFLVQRDDTALNAKLDGQTLGLRLKPATYEKLLKEGITIDEPLKTLPGAGALRIVVVDENTGRMGTLTLPASSLAKKP